MNCENPLSEIRADQMVSVLDNAPVAIYVSAIGSWELLYTNRLAGKLMKDFTGRTVTCYEAAGFDAPCPFCQVEKMVREKFLVREFYHPKTGRHFQLNGKLIQWGGVPAHVEFILDITQRKQEEERTRALEEELRAEQQRAKHLVNSIPGGIASYRMENGKVLTEFFSDGVAALSGNTREEYAELFRDDPFAIVYGPDRERVLASARTALESGNVLDISYRVFHKKKGLVWIHLNGRKMDSSTEQGNFYAVFTGMSAETRLFQSIANETADGIYVIDKETYDLLYVNETKDLFLKDHGLPGKKCYEALHGKAEPCEFCTLKSHAPDGEEHEMDLPKSGRFFATRFRETDWNGIPAYVKYVRDITKEVNIRREKERLEQYFQTVVKNLPGGVAVVRRDPDGRMIPEFISDGFADMTGMDLEQTWNLYRGDAMFGVHPDDRDEVERRMAQYIQSGETRSELTYRLQKGDGSYLWVRNNLTLIQSEGGGSRVYAVYHDITRELEAQEETRRQFNELILRHYRTPGPNALVIGHCNITKNRILEIVDHTDSGLLNAFGTVREEFFTGLSSLVVEKRERRKFLEMYLNEPARQAFLRGDTERVLNCFVKLPKDPRGRYVQFAMNLVEAPDTGDITGILTVKDTTEQTVSDRILHQLSVTSYDFVIDLDLERDAFTVLTYSKNTHMAPPPKGSHSQWMIHMAKEVLVPKDRDQYAAALAPEEIRRRLEREGSYTFSFSITDEKGDIRTKNMTVSAVDLRIGRVCLVRADITESVREQQGLLNMIAYTFELAGFINLKSGSLTMYTRKTVLENLSPFVVEDYDAAIRRFAARFCLEDGEEAQREFCIETMVRRLEEKPSGYDFVFSHGEKDALCYKQVNVLWGDENHRTVCLVRADVTEVVAAERQRKKELEKALELAKEASRAKSDFLSAMSHDIRTPMNAIIGMTALALAHQGEPERVEDCLKKIGVSSRHLLSLIGDILDMSKIESSKISLNRMRIDLREVLRQLSAMMVPQAQDAGIDLELKEEGVLHDAFYGDLLRLDQILINILGNAVKFTPKGGRVTFLTEELPSPKEGWVCYRFTTADTGVGMSEEFMKHLFDPFARSEDAADFEGTGLGLSIVKGLAELMGGSITVHSRLGEGTTFVVELAFEEAPPLDAPEDSRMNLPVGKGEQLFSGRLFLVAEDNDINAEILCELLSMFGAKTVVQRNGAAAVRAFEQSEPGRFDAVLMDIRMPKMDGYEAARTIRGMDRPDAKRIPIVAMTANAFAEDVRAARQAGMDAHVAKPIDISVLRETLARVLQRE